MLTELVHEFVNTIQHPQRACDLVTACKPGVRFSGKLIDIGRSDGSPCAACEVLLRVHAWMRSPRISLRRQADSGRPLACNLFQRGAFVLIQPDMKIGMLILPHGAPFSARRRRIGGQGSPCKEAAFGTKTLCLRSCRRRRGLTPPQKAGQEEERFNSLSLHRCLLAALAIQIGF